MKGNGDKICNKAKYYNRKKSIATRCLGKFYWYLADLKAIKIYCVSKLPNFSRDREKRTLKYIIITNWFNCFFFSFLHNQQFFWKKTPQSKDIQHKLIYKNGSFYIFD